LFIVGIKYFCIVVLLQVYMSDSCWWWGRATPTWASSVTVRVAQSALCSRVR